MAARTKIKVTPKYKTKVRVRNWSRYEESLRRRGDITVWFDADAVDSWNAPPSGRPGGQTEGFVGSLIRLMGLELRAPGLTARSRGDGCVGVELLGRLGAPVASFRADGAYDTRAVYGALDKVRAEQIYIAIPSRRTASSSRPCGGTRRHRKAALRRIDDVGRRQWPKESGANQQARAENGMVRFKQILGARLRSRSEEGQTMEAMIGVNILNRMTELGMPELGMPESVAVRS